MDRPPPLTWPAPRRVRMMLAIARAQGVSFDSAWAQVMVLEVGRDPVWRPILQDTRDEWRACYLRQPSRLEALAVLVPDLPGVQELDEASGRLCLWCEEPIGPDRDPRTVYCNDSCRRKAHYHTVERTGGRAPAGVRSTARDGVGTRRPMEAPRAA